MKILGLIPARSGSKGILGKNIKILKDKPLIWYTIDNALKSKHLDRVIVSTDSQEIAQIAQKANCEVPFIRPIHLAQDSTPMYDVLVHAIEEMSKLGFKPEIIVLLQPTSPFRTTEQIDEAVQKFLASSVRCLISVRKVRENPYWMKTLERGFLQPVLDKSVSSRQQLPTFYYPNGAIYIWNTSYLLNNKQLYPEDTIPYEMDEISSLDIDEELDWLFAEYLIFRQKK
ncbi:MAG: cytidylyltransferase domain-containing protein [Promethearchaeota archaeon]